MPRHYHAKENILYSYNEWAFGTSRIFFTAKGSKARARFTQVADATFFHGIFMLV